MAVPEQKRTGLIVTRYNSIQGVEQVPVALNPCLHLHSFNNLEVQGEAVGTHAHPTCNAWEVEPSNLKKCLLSMSVVHWK